MLQVCQRQRLAISSEVLAGVDIKTSNAGAVRGCERGSANGAARCPDAGTVHTVRGEYREVRRPERLVYSWSWEEGGERVGHVSTVTVEFLGEGERTTVVLEHSGLESQQSLERHSMGWEGALESLRARIFTRTARPS